MIKVGSIAEPAQGELYPKLTDVTGKCPPEEVGGFSGYENFLEAIADAKHPDHEDMKTWCGDTFTPNAPETDELKLEVLKLAKKWKPRKSRK